MADDTVRLNYEVQLGELQSKITETLTPLKQIDKTVADTNEKMVDGAKKASVEYGNLAQATKDTAQASKAAAQSNESLNKVIAEQKKFLIDLEKELIRVEQKKQSLNKTDEQSIRILDKQAKHLKSSIKDQRIALRELSLEKRNTAKATDGLTKSNKDLAVGSGLANNSAIEFGRTLSDAPYGIRGVANNIQQLGSNLAQLRTQTGSTRAAFKALMTAFRGPLGLLVLFQGAIALLDHFASSTQGAKKETDDFVSSVTAEGLQVQALSNVYQDSNNSLDVRRRAFEELKKSLPELTNLEYDQADAITAVNQATERQIKLLLAQARAERAVKKQVELEDELKKLDEGGIEQFETLSGFGSSLLNVFTGDLDRISPDRKYFAELGRINGELKEQKKIVKESTEERLSLSADEVRVNRQRSQSSSQRVRDIKNEIKAIKEGVDTIKFDDLNEIEFLQLQEIFKGATEDTAKFRNKEKAEQRKFIEDLAALQEKLTGITLKEIEKRDKAEDKAEQKRQQQLLRQVQQIQQFTTAVGQNFDILFSDSEDKQREFLKAQLGTLLEYLRNYALTQIAQATIGSLASPQSIATGGTVGIQQAALLTALIEAAFQGLSAVVQNFHDGSEFVTGQRGRDKIPAMIEYGERVVPARENALLNGITNKELPKAVDLYHKSQGRDKSFADRLAGSINVNSAFSDAGIIGANASVKDEIRGLRKDLKRTRNKRNGF